MAIDPSLISDKEIEILSLTAMRNNILASNFLSNLSPFRLHHCHDCNATSLYKSPPPLDSPVFVKTLVSFQSPKLEGVAGSLVFLFQFPNLVSLVSFPTAKGSSLSILPLIPLGSSSVIITLDLHHRFLPLPGVSLMNLHEPPDEPSGTRAERAQVNQRERPDLKAQPPPSKQHVLRQYTNISEPQFHPLSSEK